jgi:hypothetical protein
VDLWVQGQPDLQSEFQDRQGYTETSCLETKQNKPGKPSPNQLMIFPFRYLQRIVNHPTMLQDPDVREFLEKEEVSISHSSTSSSLTTLRHGTGAFDKFSNAVASEFA